MASSKTLRLMLRIGAKTDASYKANTEKAKRDVKRLAFGASVAVAAAYGKSMKTAASFQSRMAEVNTLLDNHKHLNGYTKAVKRVALETGTSLDNAAGGMYETISTLGDHGKQTQKIFRQIAIAAKAGGTSVKDSADLIATAMNGYGDVSAKTAKKISDLSFKTVKLGKTTFPELAQSMAPLFPLAKNLGVSYEELYASMATATTSFSGNTAEAATAMKGAFTAFLKPSTAMQQLLEKHGYSSGQALIKDKGLAGAIKLVQKEAGKDGMSKYFKNVRGLTAALGLSGKGMDKYEKNLREMKKAHGATYEAMMKKEQALPEQWKKLKNSMSIFGAELATPVIKALTPVFTKLAFGAEKITQAFNKLPGPVKTVIGTFAGIAVAVIPAALAFAKVKESIDMVKTAFEGTKLLGAVTSLSNPMIAAIIGVSIALILVIKYHKQIWNWIKKVGKCFGVNKKHVKAFKNSCKDLWKMMKTLAKFIAGKFVARFKAMVAAFKTVFRVVKTAINWFGKLLSFLKGKFLSGWRSAWKSVRNVFSSIFGGIKGVARSVLNGVIGVINLFIRAINKIHIPNKKWVPKAIRGAGFNISTIPAVYSGSKDWPGGLAEINEPRYGGEIVDLPSGSRIYPHDLSEQMINGNTAISYSPQIVIKGNASKQDIVEAEEMSMKKFRKMMDEYIRDRKNKSFKSEVFA